MFLKNMSAHNAKNLQSSSQSPLFSILYALVALVLAHNPVAAFTPRSFSGTLGQSCRTPHVLQDDLPVVRLFKKSPVTALAATEEQCRDGGGVVTSMPSRKAKHRSRKKKSLRNRMKQHSRNSTMEAALSEQDVAHHVACRYVTGPGGRLHKNKLKTTRLQQQTSILSSKADPSLKSHIEYLKKLERHPALVLNADYQPMNHLPLSMWNWQDAVKAVFSGKVTVVDVYPDVTIRAVDLEIPLPSVIALNEYVPQFNHRPAFTKRNVFLRDEYRCQYCNDFFKSNDLSLDHVIPRCRGGRLNWENAVTSCRKCNGKKGSLPLNELRSVGMKLVRQPFVPTQYQLASVAGRMLPRNVHPTWKPYLRYAGEEHTGAATGERPKAGTRSKQDHEGEMFFDGL